MRELMPVLTEHELTEWAAFDLVEPIGGRRGDYQAAVIASTVANVNRGKKGKTFGVADFVPEYGKAEQAMGLDTWLDRRIAESGAGYGDPGGQAAPAGEHPDKDDGGEHVQRAGGDVDDDGDGMGRVDATADGHA